jgi:hypothetical protein
MNIDSNYFLCLNSLLLITSNYLLVSGSETINPSTLYRVVYATNWEDVNELMVTDISLLPNSVDMRYPIFSSDFFYLAKISTKFSFKYHS